MAAGYILDASIFHAGRRHDGTTDQSLASRAVRIMPQLSLTGQYAH